MALDCFISPGIKHPHKHMDRHAALRTRTCIERTYCNRHTQCYGMHKHTHTHTDSHTTHKHIGTHMLLQTDKHAHMSHTHKTHTRTHTHIARGQYLRRKICTRYRRRGRRGTDRWRERKFAHVPHYTNTHTRTHTRTHTQTRSPKGNNIKQREKQATSSDMTG